MPKGPVHYHEGDFPPKKIYWERLIPLIGPASAALARYDGTLSAIPNADVLLSPLTTQEAVLSSRIEGTQATLTEVLEHEAGAGPARKDPNKAADIQEIQNYRLAMKKAIKLLEKLPLCLRVLREAHVALMDGVRGEGKSPGEFRKIPNWIGPPGCTIENARYVPVSAEKLPGAMDCWENHIHADTPDKLVQLAVLHAEFEALHPFLDGNGRLGRMFVPLYLFSIDALQTPMFYISAYLESKRDEYYERLLAISRDGDWTGWCIFFLNAVTEQAKANHRKARAILNLYETEKERIIELTRSQYAIHTVDFIFNRPVFSAKVFRSETTIPLTTVKRILNALKDNAILTEIRPAEGNRPAVFAFNALRAIADSNEVFADHP